MSILMGKNSGGGGTGTGRRVKSEKGTILFSFLIISLLILLNFNPSASNATDNICDSNGCAFCHGDEHGANWAGCSGCHDSPPQTGTHLVHNGSAPAVLLTYGDTSITSDTNNYKFGCGNCHPRDVSKHRDGTVEIELSDAGAPSGSIKFKNPSNATYTPGTNVTTYQGHTNTLGSFTFSYSDGRCSNVYCHSGPSVSSETVGNPLSCARTALEYFNQTANFTSGSILTGAVSGASGMIIADSDGGSSGVLTLSGLGGSFQNGETITDASGGTATAGGGGGCIQWTYAPYTVSYSRAYVTTPSWGTNSDAQHTTFTTCTECHQFPPATSYPSVQAGVGDSHQWIDDNGYGNLHAYDMGFDPISCRTCHYGTVTQANTYSRNAMDITTYDAVPLASRSYHVNGTKDVIFDVSDSIVYASSLYGFNESLSLSGAAYDSATKSCSNIACHSSNGYFRKYQTPVTWGSPYRWWISNECNLCHQN